MDDFLKYLKARQQAHFNQDRQINNCIKLWFAVCEQVFTDAGSNSRKARVLKSKRKAIEWFISDNENLEFICSMTGMDPKLLRIKALKIFRRDRYGRRILSSILGHYKRNGR